MVQRAIFEKIKEMTNKEQIQRDMAVAFDFIEHIIDHPAEADNIPHGAAISFLNQGVKKKEKRSESSLQKKYVKVKRHFELL
jgi:hypothetical protein